MVRPKINNSLLSDIVVHDISMIMPIKYNIKRMIKDIKTFIALICASVFGSLNPVLAGVSPLGLVSLDRWMLNSTRAATFSTFFTITSSVPRIGPNTSQ